MNTYLRNQVLQEAYKSYVNHRYGAILIDKRGRIISKGYNKLKLAFGVKQKSCFL